MPWRVGKSSANQLYFRILSEFMLQQTQVKTVIPYFEKFTNKFPNLKSLAKSNEKQILKLWEGLGYYRRAKNLLASSKILVNEYNSILPKDINEIKKLPGVGDYTANVLLALIYNKRTIAFDGNVKRVFSRIINKDEKKIDFQRLISLNYKTIFNTNRNSDLVEALMEFGALICKPKVPMCEKCFLKKNCKYNNPVKKIKKNKRIFKQENLNIFCYLTKNGKIALTKKNNLGYLNKFNLPQVRKRKEKESIKNWKLLRKYNNFISNKKLNINLYYRFSQSKPNDFNWYSIKENKDFMPTFTKKIFKQISILF